MPSLSNPAFRFFTSLKAAHQNIVTSLLHAKGGQFATFVIETEPSKMRKRGNPLAGRVKIRKQISVQFQDYAGSQERKGKEPVGRPTPWKEHFNRWLTAHKEKGQLYFEYMPKQVKSKQYLVDDRPATREEIRQIKLNMPPVTESPEWCMVKIDNIKEARMGGNVFQV